MKKYGTLIALAVAVIFGITAVFLANKWMSSRVTEQTVVVKEQVPLTEIVIAGKDLGIGAMLEKENLTLAPWPKANVPKGAFTKIEDLAARLTVKAEWGEMLTDANIAAALPAAVEMCPQGSPVGKPAKISAAWC